MEKINSRLLIGSGIVVAALLISFGVASAQSAAFSNEFGVGAQGSTVTNLQTWLTEKGYYSGPITGYYGSLTQAAVERFQSGNGISATGYVGPLTLAALNSMDTGVQTTATVSANSNEILQLESELNSLLAQIQAIDNNPSASAPAASSITLQTNEDVGTSGTLTASGTGPFTYTIVSDPPNGSVTSFNSQTGAFTYTPNANFTGTDSFTYTVGNGYGTSSAMTVTVDVVPTSSITGAPTGQNLSFSTTNGASINGTLVASGTGPYTYTIVTSPSYGTINSFTPSNGSFTYTPNSGYTGTDSFTYTIGNGTATSSSYTVTLSD